MSDTPGTTVPLIKMLGDQILVQPVEADTKVGSLEVPQQYTSWMRKARVVAVGEGLRAPGNGMLIPLSVKVGDVVMHRKLKDEIAEMCRVIVGREQYLVLKAGDLVAVVPS